MISPAVIAIIISASSIVIISAILNALKGSKKANKQIQKAKKITRYKVKKYTFYSYYIARAYCKDNGIDPKKIVIIEGDK